MSMAEMSTTKVGVPRGGSASLAPSLDPPIKTDKLYMLSVYFAVEVTSG